MVVIVDTAGEKKEEKTYCACSRRYAEAGGNGCMSVTIDDKELVDVDTKLGMLVTIGIVVVGGSHCHRCSWCGGLAARALPCG